MLLSDSVPASEATDTALDEPPPKCDDTRDQGSMRAIRIEESADRVELRVIGGRKDGKVSHRVWRLDPTSGRFEFVE